jgi:hypothetical protein
MNNSGLPLLMIADDWQMRSGSKDGRSAKSGIETIELRTSWNI